jgi:predicted dehydrogenase
VTAAQAPSDERPVVSVGMLGYGFMGKTHSNALKTLPYIFWPGTARVRLSTISGRTEAGVREAATRYGWENYTTDWRDIVNDPDIQIFDNVGPDSAHFEPTLAAIGAGKHVVCEKPLGDWKQSVILANAAEKAGVLNLTAFNYRFVPAVRLAHDMIANGELGDIYSANFRYAQEWHTDPTADFGNKTGALDVIGSHAIDAARYLVGEVESVSALITNPLTSPPRGEPIDTVDALVKFDNGATGTISATLIAPGRKNRLGWEINGSKGSVYWDLENLNVLHHFDRAGASREGFMEIIVNEQHHPLVAPWWPSAHVLVDAVVSGAQSVGPEAATFADGAAAAQIGEAILRAAASGERVTIASIS